MAEANVNMKVEETTTESSTEQPVEQPAPAQRQVSLLQIPVNTENDALNMLVALHASSTKRSFFIGRSIQNYGICKCISKKCATTTSNSNRTIANGRRKIN